MLKVVIKGTTIVLESDVMICTRLAGNRIAKVLMNCDGTTADFQTKCNRIANVDNELFIMFDKMRAEANSTLEVDEN